MSIDKLHDRIRKLKNPSVIDFGIKPDRLPPYLLEAGELAGYVRFCNELMDALKETVPAVRFPFGAFALYGPEGLAALQGLLKRAGELGFYVLMDSPEILSPWNADRTAEMIFDKEIYPCDGLLISTYIGADGIKPFVPYCKDGKDLFCIVRSPNKTAAELQDLLTGSRHVYNAAAELVNRHGESILGRCGYSRIAGVVSAGSPDVSRQIRLKHNRMFLLVDGLDYPSGNAKNCSHAFDRFGYGAVVCAGPSVTAAWKDAESDGLDYVELAVQAAERMKKNLCRYVTIL